VVRPFFRTLGLDVDEDGTVRELDLGAVHVGRDKDGGVHGSGVEDLGAQVAAAEALLNRVYGKPRQALEHTGASGRPIEVARSADLRKLTNEELDQLEQLLLRASPEPVPWSPVPTRRDALGQGAQSVSASHEHQHPFVRRLRRALVEDARANVLLALRVHALAARGHTNAQIAERLGASTRT